MTTPSLRPMYKSDTAAVIRIINAYDDDDAEAAQADYEEEGVENQYVLEIEDKVVGVTGYRQVPATDNTCWLSWTYLDPEYRSQGHGKAIMLELLEKLKAAGMRKLFVKVSDYEEPKQGKVYARALNMYKSLGFKEELVSKDFYDEDEDQIMLGLDLSGEEDSNNESVVKDEKPVIRFNGLFEIAETDGAYTFSWDVNEAKLFFGKRSFSVEDLVIGIKAVKDDGGRKIFLTFPSNLPLIHKPLQAAGFKFVGRLKNYYERGVDELHFTHDLGNH